MSLRRWRVAAVLGALVILAAAAGCREGDRLGEEQPIFSGLPPRTIRLGGSTSNDQVLGSHAWHEAVMASELSAPTLKRYYAERFGLPIESGEAVSRRSVTSDQGEVILSLRVYLYTRRSRSRPPIRNALLIADTPPPAGTRNLVVVNAMLLAE